MSTWYEVKNETRDTVVSRLGDLRTAELYYEDCIKKHLSNTFSIYEIVKDTRKKIK